MRRSLSWHLNDVSERGISAVLEKTANRFRPLLWPIGGAFARLLLLLLGVFFQVTLIKILTDRVGHLAIDPYVGEKVLKEEANRNGRYKNKRRVVIWIGTSYVANRFLLTLWQRRLGIRIWRVPILGLVAENFRPRDIPNTRVIEPLRQYSKYLTGSPVRFQLSRKEIGRAKAGLGQLGIKPDDEWVCLLVRDSAYLPDPEWQYHSYRDCDINSFTEAAIMLADKGYFVVRMGAKTNNCWRVGHPRVIDYSNSGIRSELLDIYLTLNCSFFLSTSTGLDSLAVITGRPVAVVNLTPLRGFIETLRAFPSNIHVIPKHYLKHDNSSWKLSELIEFGLADFYSADDYNLHGIKLSENSSEEITELTLQMLASLETPVRPKKERDNDETSFWDLWATVIPELNCNGNYIQVGKKFLRDNAQWCS